MKKKTKSGLKKFKNRLKKRFKRPLVVLIGTAITVWLLFVVADVFGWGPAGEPRNVKISEGCNVTDIAKILEENEIIDFPLFFRIYEKFDGEEHVFQKGGHILCAGMSYNEIIGKLTSMPDVRADEVVTVTVPEGYEVRQIADLLTDVGLVNRERFMEEVENGRFDYDFLEGIERTGNRLEGYLFPDTYEFFVGESEHDIICHMLDAFCDKVVPVYESAETEFTLDEVVIFASVVEREAADDAERPIVASVFYNRMEADMTLSSCATVQYIIEERKPVLSNDDIAIKSDYNTYINKGLPVGPIASPGVNSIKAVLCPADTDYLYFAARPDGSENVFSETGEEHMQIVAELQGK